MGNDRIRIAVSGLGRIGWPFHCAQIAKHPQFEFVAVQDLEPARRAEAERVYGVRSYESFTTMLAENKLDVVTIATPTHLHRAMAIEALHAGCHVMLEKPMAPNSADAAAIVREADRRQRVLTVYQPHRAHAYSQHLRALIGSGTVGDVYHARVGMFQFAIRNDWQALKKFGGGMLNNYGAHAIDLLLHLIGYDVQRLFCSLRIVASVGDAEDVVRIVLETKGGVIGEVEINQACTASPYFIDVIGTRGTISLPPTDNEHFTIRTIPADAACTSTLNPSLASPDRRYPGDEVPIQEKVIPVDQNLEVDVYADLARAITTGSQPFVRAEEPLAVMRLIDRCRKDAGRIVESRITAPRGGA